MTPHEPAPGLLALARADEQAASMLDTSGMRDALVGFDYQQAVERVLAEQSVGFPKTHETG